jgi:hypothetical protein
MCWFSKLWPKHFYSKNVNLEIRRIPVQSQPRQIVCKTLSQKTPAHKNRAGGVAQGEQSNIYSAAHKQNLKQ